MLEIGTVAFPFNWEIFNLYLLVVKHSWIISTAFSKTYCPIQSPAEMAALYMSPFPLSSTDWTGSRYLSHGLPSQAYYMTYCRRQTSPRDPLGQADLHSQEFELGDTQRHRLFVMGAEVQ